MRNDFIQQTLIEMHQNKNIYFLTGDLGFNALEPIQQKFPNRFINAGIAEANMIGIAAGLALTGKKVIAYSIASFLTMRAYEQIRDDLCYHNLDVKLVGTGGGFNYSHNGVTHFTIEDVAILAPLPHMKIICPAYSWEARGATAALFKDKGPAYIRLSKKPKASYEKSNWKFKLGKGYTVKSGKEIVLISTGNVLDLALATADLVESLSTKKVTVVSMPTIKPFDESLLGKLSRNAEFLGIIEEHSMIGGLGSMVGNFLLLSGLSSGLRFKIFGFPDSFIKDVGDREYLLTKAGLSAEEISSAILKKIKR